MNYFTIGAFIMNMNHFLVMGIGTVIITLVKKLTHIFHICTKPRLEIKYDTNFFVSERFALGTTLPCSGDTITLLLTDFTFWPIPTTLINTHAIWPVNILVGRFIKERLTVSTVQTFTYVTFLSNHFLGN